MRQPDRQNLDTFLFDKSFGGWWNLSQSWPMSSPMIMHDPGLSLSKKTIYILKGAYHGELFGASHETSHEMFE